MLTFPLTPAFLGLADLPGGIKTFLGHSDPAIGADRHFWGRLILLGHYDLSGSRMTFLALTFLEATDLPGGRYTAEISELTMHNF